MIDGETMRAFLDANQMALLPRNTLDSLLGAMESLKCPVEDDVMDAVNHMNDCCQELVKRYLQRTT